MRICPPDSIEWAKYVHSTMQSAMLAFCVVQFGVIPCL